MRSLLGLLGLVGLASCLASPAVECADGRLCPPGTLCDDIRGGCVQPGQVDSCANQPDLTSCSYPGVPDGSCYDGVCLPAGCGNGILDPDEACDDGNRLHGDGCSADCRSDETCGNGVPDIPVGESCDDGKQCSDGTPCTQDADCAAIGDAVCATRDGDGCQATCVTAACGDGIIDAEFREACDCGDGPESMPDDCATVNGDDPDASCRSNCQPRRCGDNIIDPGAGEECDDGNVLPGDGCSGACRFEVCGNGILDVIQDETGFVPAEECDDGDPWSGDGCTSLCVREQPAWSAVDAGLPPARHGHAMAYDPARGRTVLFGGHVTAGAFWNDTWEWDGARWRDVSPTSGAPPPRYQHAMAYDAARGRVVLFGGFTSEATTARRDDTWVWDGGSWTDVTPLSNSIGSRGGHAMAYDAGRQRVVLFGGHGATFLSDTYEWDGSSWQQIFPAGPSPPAREDHALAYDPVRGKVVLYGGLGSGGTTLDDTWEWDGTSWTQVTPATSSPGPRRDHAMAFDPVLGQVVLFGDSTYAFDLWAWDGTDWTKPASAGKPPGVAWGAMVFDLARGEAVRFGGFGSTGERNDTWTWDGAWHDRTSAFITPPDGGNEAMAYDAGRGRVVLLSSDPGDTWEWDGTRWTMVAPVVSSPPPRWLAAMAYDAGEQRIVLFGGDGGRDDTWKWDGAAWTDVTPVSGSPPGRYGHTMVYDASRDRVVLFGGQGGSIYGDTWEWDGSAWSDVTPTGDSPATRVYAGLAYDPVRERAVLFGGRSTPTTGRNDTWEWDGTSWADVTPAVGAPPERFLHGMAYDAARRRVVVYAGENALDDTWEWDGTAWAQVIPATAVPAARAAHVMAYDAARRQTLARGGYEFSTFSWAIPGTLAFAYQHAPVESCVYGLDGDGDGLVGCDDPDCWGYCAPFCPPGAACDAAALRCGDGDCNPWLESCRLCPSDCGACTPLCGDFVCDTGEAPDCPGDC